MRFISHLDVLRYWERSIRRARLPLSYSAGFTPHPRLAFAAPLPLGFVGEAEVVDATFDEPVDLEVVRELLAEQATPDIQLLDIREVAVNAPAPQAQLRWADYRWRVAGLNHEAAAQVVTEFLAQETFEFTDRRKEKPRTMDIRAGVAKLEAFSSDGGTGLFSRLRADQDLTVRPETIMDALFPGIEAEGFTRTAMHFEDVSPAREAYRRLGRFLE